MKDRRMDRVGAGPGGQMTHFKYFVYQICQYLLNANYGSPAAHSYHFEQVGCNPTRLIIYNQAGEAVLNDGVANLQRKLEDEKWPELYYWRQ